MITFNLWELERETQRMLEAEADHRVRRLFVRSTAEDLPVAIVVPRGRRGWRR